MAWQATTAPMQRRTRIEHPLIGGTHVSGGRKGKMGRDTILSNTQMAQVRKNQSEKELHLKSNQSTDVDFLNLEIQFIDVMANC